MSQVVQEVRMALSIFSAAYNNIEDRTKSILDKRNKMKELKPAVDEFQKLDAEIKELVKENNNDRKYVSETIGFYEKRTGESVGLGELFSQEKEESIN